MTHELRVQRLIGASPESVFDAFTDPAAQREMYADAPDWVVRSECDLREGGRWTIEFGPPGAVPARETCVFQVVERPGRLLYVSTMLLADGSSLDTRTLVMFEPAGPGRTLVTVVQSGFPEARWRDEFRDGWGAILAGLDRAVAAR